MADEMADLNLFMMCESLNRKALVPMPAGFHIRPIRREELSLWQAIHFDDPADAIKYAPYMAAYYENVYAPMGDLFFDTCLFACDSGDRPVGTCFLWQAYGLVTTLHWLKVVQAYEGQGIGRALISHVMGALPRADYPVYLHTQPSSCRAIKLYSDFGFALLTDGQIGHRANDLQQALPILKQYMPPEVYASLRFTAAPEALLRAAASSPVNQF